jgi:hypothetical protein
MTRTEPARADATPESLSGAQYSRNGMPDPASLRLVEADAEVDAIVAQVIADELELMRTAFGSGAEYAVTHIESPRERMLHRLECPALEPHLDRHAQWTAEHRRRLAADGRHRLSVPALVTRDSARRLSGVRSCKVCWPNVHGRDPRPLRRLKARGLRPHHVGHVLSTEDGDSLGTIVSSAIQIQQADLFDVKQDAVEVVTSSRTLRYSPSEHVFIWDLPTDEVAIERKMQLFERLGSGLTQAY